MAILGIVKADSRRGHKLLARLERRGDDVLDRSVLNKARAIVDSVRHKGDKGLLAAVRKFDGVAARSVDELRRVPVRTDRRDLPAGFEHALERAIVAVERYHERQRHDGFCTVESGVELVERRQPLRRVGIYVPGGRATYPSTVVMTVVPAKLAGVDEIVVATPRAAWERSPALRHTLERLGVREVWTLGGAHAVAALAFGTETVPRVDKIVGPGNAWVTAGKALVQGHVAIDGLAGPSEVLIVASGRDLDAELIAADLLAQAEHDPQATALLITDRTAVAKEVARQVASQLPRLATAATAKAALANFGAAVVVDDMEVALRWIDRVAPEHLQLVGDEAEALESRVRNAGAIFLGASTPEVFGDYLAGPSHVLPTAGTARFTSALGVEDFIRRSHVIRFSPPAAARSAAAVGVLAEVEGLPAHAAAARLRVRFGDGR
ncbi:MAG: histidinol dehydrogenase [Acidobacteriota bacterium]